MGRFLLFLAAAVALTVGTPVDARSQTAVAVETGPIVLVGDDAGVATMQLGVRAGGARPNTLHPDVAFATLPEALASGLLVGLADFDLGYDQKILPRLSLAVRGGGSTLFGFGGGGAGLLLGYNVGAGIIVRPGKSAGLRLDFTYRRLAVEDETYPIASLTVGFIVGH